MKRRFKAVPAPLFLVSTWLFLACSESSGTAPPSPDAPEPTTVAVNPDRVTLDAVGQTVQFTAVVRDQLGREMPEVPVTWYCSDEAVATVSASGLATAVGDGNATVLAAASASAFGWAEMTVSGTPIEIVTNNFPPGVVSLPYRRVLEAKGVTTPSWSLSAGSLPDGLLLDEDTGEVSGTPLSAGASTFTVMLSGSGHSTTKEFSLTIVTDEFGVDFEEDQFALIPAGE
ncbi:MAG: Ig-like domain-containing protein, partial [Longimicrobiales bacterium]